MIAISLALLLTVLIIVLVVMVTRNRSHKPVEYIAATGSNPLSKELELEATTDKKYAESQSQAEL